MNTVAPGLQGSDFKLNILSEDASSGMSYLDRLCSSSNYLFKKDGNISILSAGPKNHACLSILSESQGKFWWHSLTLAQCLHFFFNIKIYPVCLVFVVSVIFLNLCVMRAKLLQLCPTLRDPMDQSPPGSSVHGILQHEYWSELPCPLWGALPDPGIKPVPLTSPALAGRVFTLAPPGKPYVSRTSILNQN